MAPHLSSSELADIRKWQHEGKTPTEIHVLHRKDRRSRRMKPVCLTALRKTIKRLTYRGPFFFDKTWPEQPAW